MHGTMYPLPARNLLWGLLATASCAFLTGCAETPQSAYETIIKCGENRQYDRVWDRIDKKSQGKIEAGLGLAAKFAAVGAAIGGDKKKADELQSLKGKDLFVRMCEVSEKARTDFVNQKVKSVKAEGDRATLTVAATKDGKEQERTVVMIKEDGIWKMTVDQ
jgi:hypothetical protein